MSQGCLGWKPRGGEGAELDVEHWGRAGSCIPKSQGKEQAARGNTEGSVTGTFPAPPLLGAPPEPIRETSPLPARGRVWGRTSCPGAQPMLLPKAGTAQQDTQGTQLSPNPEPSRVQRSEQDQALTGTKPQQLLCPAAPRPCQGPQSHQGTQPQCCQLRSQLWEQGEGAA